MSNKKITYNPNDKAFKVQKYQLKRFILDKIERKCPENLSLLTKKIIISTLIYLEGYGDRLKEEINPPIIKQDIKKFLMEQGYKYALKQIEKDNH